MTPGREEAERLMRNKQLVIRHFDDFVNRQDLAAIDRNMSADFHDHDGPGGPDIRLGADAYSRVNRGGTSGLGPARVQRTISLPHGSRKHAL